MVFAEAGATRSRRKTLQGYSTLFIRAGRGRASADTNESSGTASTKTSVGCFIAARHGEMRARSLVESLVCLE
jgi:hypothetical protein